MPICAKHRTGNLAGLGATRNGPTVWEAHSGPRRAGALRRLSSNAFTCNRTPSPLVCFPPLFIIYIPSHSHYFHSFLSRVKGGRLWPRVLPRIVGRLYDFPLEGWFMGYNSLSLIPFEDSTNTVETSFPYSNSALEGGLQRGKRGVNAGHRQNNSGKTAE